MTASNRSETFGRLLKAGIASIANCEGKTAPVIEDELGAQIGVAGKSIQRYKAGYLPPEARTVQILAEVCVRRGMMGREWLEAFLHHARHHQADKLLDQLRPLGPTRPRPPRVYENLPAPTYSQFVMRPQAFAEVLDGLQQRSAAVLIVGLGGNGKTSLAREVAARCLRDDEETPRFDAVVWVSDKDRPGTTNLSTVLDEIARTLDYPGFTQFEHDEKRREVEQLLRRQRVLLVVDNFETITDSALLSWLLRLPEPSKAMITSREKHRALWGSWLVELRGMSETEAWELITERARVLKITQLDDETAHLKDILTATGGNPKALSMILGLLKHERRPLKEVVADLHAARGDLFDDLFTRAWALLDEAARRVLLVATFFHASASAESLSATADVKGFAFDRVGERLSDLALLDVQQADLNSLPRYALHPLVQAFAGARLAEQPGFEAGARDRWVRWYVNLTAQVGYCWNDLDRLKLLDPERETIPVILEWTSQSPLHAETLHIAQKCSYYYYVRGLWDSKPPIHLIAAEAASKLSQPLIQAKELAYHVEWCAEMGRFPEADLYLPKLRQVTTRVDVPADTFYQVRHALALYLLVQNHVDQAQSLWRQTLEEVPDLPPRYRLNLQRFLATCLARKGLLNEARLAYMDTLHEAVHHGHTRQILNIQTELAAIALEQGNLESAAEILNDVYPKALQFQERRVVCQTQRLYAQLHALRRDIPAAREALRNAIDILERFGLMPELAEARAELARLDALGALTNSAPKA